MRVINKEYVAPVTTNVTIVATKAELQLILEDKAYKTVKVTVVEKSDDDRVLDTKEYLIEGENYELLMSESPDFSPNKPLNEYREVDLWYFVDLLRNDLS